MALCGGCSFCCSPHWELWMRKHSRSICLRHFSFHRMSDASETHQPRFAWRRCRSMSFLFVSMFHQTDTVLSAEVSIFLTLSDVSLALAEEQTDCRVWFVLKMDTVRRKRRREADGNDEEEWFMITWACSGVFSCHYRCLQLLLSLGTLAGWLGASSIIHFHLPSIFYSTSHIPHSQRLQPLPWSMPPHSSASSLAAPLSRLWQISISIVRSGTEPNGPYRHSLCSCSPWSLRMGRVGSFLLCTVLFYFCFLSVLCVFMCVSWWSFFPPRGNSEVIATSLWSLLTTDSVQMLKGIVQPNMKILLWLSHLYVVPNSVWIIHWLSGRSTFKPVSVSNFQGTICWGLSYATLLFFGHF